MNNLKSKIKNQCYILHTYKNSSYEILLFCYICFINILVQLISVTFIMSNFVSPWTAAWQAPLSMGFSKQEYWSGLPHPPPRELPDPGFQPASLVSLALAGRFFTTGTTWEAHTLMYH